MTEDPSLKNLSAKIEEAKANSPDYPSGGKGINESNSGFALAMRLSVELLAGVLVGAVIGFLLDKAFGSSPWILILFIFLGFAAGVRNMMRAAETLDNGSK